jgi:hypothetical protein
VGQYDAVRPTSEDGLVVPRGEKLHYEILAGANELAERRDEMSGIADCKHFRKITY